MKLQRFRFSVPFNFSKKILLLLLIGHMPNRYIGGALYILLFLFTITRTSHIYFLPETKKNYLLLLAAYGLCIFSFIFHYSHINNLIWGLFNASPILLIPFLFPKQILKQPFLNSLKIFILFEVFFFIFQYIQAALEFKQLNIFVGNSGAGDSLTGSLLGRTGAPITVSLCFCILILFSEFIKNKKKDILIFMLLSAILAYLPGNMSSIFCLFATFICYLFLSFFSQIIIGKIKRGTLIIGVMGITVFSLGWFIESENILYGIDVFGKLFRVDPPIKVKAVFSTIEMLQENKEAPIVGVGLGNFASRAAYMVSGEYLFHQPIFIPATPSEYTSHYLLSIWNRSTSNKIIGGSIGDSMINEPFNQYLAFLGEGGIGAFIALLLIYLLMLKKGLRRPQSELLILISIFSLALLTTNLWIDFPNFAIMFWIGIKYSNIHSLRENILIVENAAV
jgi:hypothetical protein